MNTSATSEPASKQLSSVAGACSGTGRVSLPCPLVVSHVKKVRYLGLTTYFSAGDVSESFFLGGGGELFIVDSLDLDCHRLKAETDICSALCQRWLSLLASLQSKPMKWQQKLRPQQQTPHRSE